MAHKDVVTHQYRGEEADQEARDRVKDRVENASGTSGTKAREGVALELQTDVVRCGMAAQPAAPR